MDKRDTRIYVVYQCLINRMEDVSHMAKHANKIAKSFRIDRAVIALMETYARDNQMTQTDVVELAIKRLCRQSAAPATQQDIAALAELVKANQAATLAAIHEQPIQIAGAMQPPNQIADAMPSPKKRDGRLRRLLRPFLPPYE